MGGAQSQWVVVYRGLSAGTVDVVEAMLRAQGLTPHRQGRGSPALAGVGMHALEQRISVRAEEADRAQELLEAFDDELDDDALEKLETEALGAAPVPQPGSFESASRLTYVTLVVAMLATLATAIWLSR